MIDSRDINELHPALMRGALELKRRMGEKGYAVGISSTYRDHEAQDALYAKGRTAAGSIVTNARGGQSIHNYRLAFDVFLNIVGQEYSNASFFTLAGKEWEAMGGEWGGSWTGFVDRPHMQYTGGLTLSDLQKGKVLHNDAKMPWELELENQESEGAVEMRYHTIEEIPDWGKEVVKKLVARGVIAGNGESLDLSADMVRLLVWNDRAGLYQ